MTSKRDGQDANRKALFGEIARGAEVAFRNAEELFSEASLLGKHRALSRSLFLHQISLEECGKIELLTAWATGLLMGEEIDPRKLTKALVNHKAKNHANAYMLDVSDEEQAARKNRDWKAAIGLFEERQKAFHEESNTAKNASLYVDFNGERFAAPSDRITKDMVSEIVKRNREYLGLMYPKVRLLSKWNSDIDKTAEKLRAFKALALKFREEMPNDPEKAMTRMLEEMLETATRGEATKSG
ncbi:AbiV family abortive infection protein [Bradyrhizobium tropiciagri]|uniref:AbiV family abortive infection protein n=1 Tax=Bradyrhizobium tropiciagri TaxID=312253 RepID=UPI001BAD02E4|nr:AbiV family abortive infection protein [Bradyrhizobium tropiciagri]MBR0900270.1 AbiV family abortive infection protein [Bradyrhizobium tropiciagri]